MKMNQLGNLEQVFERSNNEIIVAEELIDRALVPLKRMLEFGNS
jgi:quinolinate synthase